MSEKAPAGWYDHPTMANTRRYWDGQSWTDQIIEKAAPTAPAAPPPAAFAGPATARSSWLTPKVLAPIVALVLVAAGLGLFLVLNKDTFTVSGTMSLEGSDNHSGGMGCSGNGGYDDLEAGAQVTIRNNSGKSLAVGSLGRGEEFAGACVFPFDIDDVPADGDLYSIEVTHRGEVSFTRDKASSVALSIGN